MSAVRHRPLVRAAVAVSFVATVGLVASSAAYAGSSVAARHAAAGRHGSTLAKDTTLGHELCKHSTPFFYMIYSDIGGSDPTSWCYDGTAKHPAVPKEFKGLGLVAALDNQTGRQLILTGKNSNGGKNYRYCYDRGFDWALGPPAAGGDMEQDLLLDSVTAGVHATCPVWAKGAGTNDPGAAPAAAPSCQVSGHYANQGGHVFLVTGYELGTEDGVDDETHYYCLAGSPGTTEKSKLFGSVLTIANGAPHRVIVTGKGFSVCIPTNHVISQVKPADQNDITSITVASSSKRTCPK